MRVFVCKRSLLFVFVFGLIALGQSSWAAEIGEVERRPLDPAYPNLQHPVEDTGLAEGLREQEATASDLRSDLAKALRFQTPVRDQAERGTCSIFSSVAWIESYLLRNGLVSSRSRADLSEEWLQYLIARSHEGDGSNSVLNFSTIAEWGLAREKSLPYVQEDWADKKLRNKRTDAQKRCGDIAETKAQDACFIGHFHPDALNWADSQLESSSASSLIKARKEAALFVARLKDHAGGDLSRQYAISRVSEVKALLRAGIPLTLDVDYFFGAWNDSWGKKYGMAPDKNARLRGIVGYPEKGSIDRAESPREPSGHSVLCVGYDDSIEVTVKSRQVDGSTQTFRYRGVYFIKNSWGTEDFGSRFESQGVSAPGYGMITQKYAHEFGGFYRLQLPESIPALGPILE